MDSLLANYATSDEEEEQPEPRQNLGIPSKVSEPSSTSIFSSLPQPTSSLFSLSLPPPKSQLATIQAPKKPLQSNALKSVNDYDNEETLDSAFNYKGTSKTTLLFSSLPGPKSHLSSAQPPQKPLPSNTHTTDDEADISATSRFSDTNKATRLFSSLPDPKSNLPSLQTVVNISSSDPNRKRVVQFKPPIVNPSSGKSRNNIDDEDDNEDEEDKDRKRRRESENLAQPPSVKSFLSSILPTPKNSRMTLGALPSSGSGRRSIIDADVPASRVENEASTDYSNVQNYEGNQVDRSSSAAYEALDVKSGLVMTGSDPSEWAQGNQNYENYDGYGNYENYNSLGQYESNWIDRSTTGTMSETAGTTESLVQLPFKRGRNEIPTDIIEVNQDELIKNRPREDQTKSTGIAFGPSYQPASTKGKPTKLHKRKHQISSLYYDMKQKEMELTDRRAKGFLTKAETQAKYGW